MVLAEVPLQKPQASAGRFSGRLHRLNMQLIKSKRPNRCVRLDACPVSAAFPGKFPGKTADNYKLPRSKGDPWSFIPGPPWNFFSSGHFFVDQTGHVL